MFQNTPALTHLFLNATQVTGKLTGWYSVTSVPKTFLDDDLGDVRMFENTPKLEALNLRWCRLVTGEVHLECFCDQSLRTILDYTLGDISAFAGCKNLRHLLMYGCKSIGGAFSETSSKYPSLLTFFLENFSGRGRRSL